MFYQRNRHTAAFIINVKQIITAIIEIHHSFICWACFMAVLMRLFYLKCAATSSGFHSHIITRTGWRRAFGRMRSVQRFMLAQHIMPACSSAERIAQHSIARAPEHSRRRHTQHTNDRECLACAQLFSRFGGVQRLGARVAANSLLQMLKVVGITPVPCSFDAQSHTQRSHSPPSAAAV